MRVFVLGAGAVGTVIAGQLAKSKDIESIVVADIDPRKTEALKKKVRSGKIETAKADARSVESLAKAANGCGMIVNASLPDFNLEVMEAALKVKAHYMDMSTGGPKEATTVPELADQMAFNERYKKAGLAGMLCMGVDPGTSNIFARYLADRMDKVEELLVRDGDNSSVEGYHFAGLFSPATLIEECLLPPLVYRDGKFSRLKPLGEPEYYDFPEPVGRLATYYVDHEEVETLPVNFKGLKRCDFKYALGEQFVEALRLLDAIGFTKTKPVKVGDVYVKPKDVLVSLMPDPAELGPKVKGHTCVGVEAAGIEDGKHVRKYMYTLASHDECFKRYGVTGTAWQTGVPPAIGVEMMARGEIALRGTFTPELMDPEPWPEELRKHGMPVEIRVIE